MQSRWSHLSKIPLDIVNKDIYILIGANMPQLHINYDAVMARPNEPIADKIRMGSVRR